MFDCVLGVVSISYLFDFCVCMKLVLEGERAVTGCKVFSAGKVFLVVSGCGTVLCIFRVIM